MITNATIAALNPCKDRHDNYLKFYANTSLTPRQFMGRKNITQVDKLWVAFRSIPKESISKCAAEIAKSVLHIYEAKYPNDSRVRDCIEATLAGTVTREQRNAATAAASYATTAASYASNAAYYAASAAAYYAADAAASAAADAAASAADYAASAAAATSYARSKQEKLIRTIILRYWK